MPMNLQPTPRPSERFKAPMQECFVLLHGLDTNVLLIREEYKDTFRRVFHHTREEVERRPAGDNGR